MTNKTNEMDKHIGNRIRIRRSLMGVSKAELGRLIGKSGAQIAKYEKGQSSISAIDLHKIAEKLGVTMGYFFK